MDDVTARARTGCQACWPEDGQLGAADFHRAPIEVALAESSHFCAHILRCPACSSHYLFIFTERIDWAEGNDSQQTSLLPISVDEVQALRTAREPARPRWVALARGRQVLTYDSERAEGERYQWRLGLTIGPHD